MSRVQRRARPQPTPSNPTNVGRSERVRSGFHEYIPIGELHIDTTYQRDINYPFITEMARDFDYNQLDLQSWAIGRRLQGTSHTDYIIDGQHRWLALLQREQPDFVVDCMVRISPGSDWEANEYLRINFARKNPTSAGKYKAAVVAGRKFGWTNSAEVAELLAELGIPTVQHTGQTYSPHGGARGGPATLYAIGKVERHHEVLPDVTRLVLTSMRDAWAERAPTSAYDGIVLDGLMDFYAAHDTETTVEAVVRVLQTVKPPELRDAADEMRATKATPLRAYVARVVAVMYNRGKRLDSRLSELAPINYVTARRSRVASATVERMAPEERAAWRERAREGILRLTPEERSASARKGRDTLGPEGRSEQARKANLALTPEQRSERSRRAYETRRKDQS